jgi:16S rRNA (guanine966-N2)-methyltransferase
MKDKKGHRGTLRITGGIYRGRRIQCPPGVIRPAMDRMRESFFAILGDLAGVSFLDLFCGSGVVGIEAASRGADPVVLVDKDRLKRQTILRNIQFIQSQIALKIIPAERFIEHNRDVYDLVYLDPPFSHPEKLRLIQSIERRRILSPSGRLTIHLPQEESIPERIGRLKIYDGRAYGRSRLLFFRYT